MGSGWKGLYFGGVAFKYQNAVWDVEGAARTSRSFVDVVTTSGPGSGIAAAPAKIQAMRVGLGVHPLALASGVTPTNVTDYLPYVDCFLVATGISRDFYELDEAKCARLAQEIHAAG